MNNLTSNQRPFDKTVALASEIRLLSREAVKTGKRHRRSENEKRREEDKRREEVVVGLEAYAPVAL